MIDGVEHRGRADGRDHERRDVRRDLHRQIPGGVVDQRDVAEVDHFGEDGIGWIAVVWCVRLGGFIGVWGAVHYVGDVPVDFEFDGHVDVVRHVEGRIRRSVVGASEQQREERYEQQAHCGRILPNRPFDVVGSFVMNCILVTGGAGYVGSQSVLYLKEQGHRVVVFDDLSTGHRDFAAHADAFIEGTLLDRERVFAALSDARPDAILHCAAKALVIESVANPMKYFRQNLIGAIHLAEAAKAHGRPPIVFSSSGTVYGIQGEAPIDETATPAPINPYGVSKRMVEQILEEEAKTPGDHLRSLTLRYFNAAGADPAQRVGERHDPETHLIPNLLAVPGPFTICGTDFPTRDGTCLRDYVHTHDLARAHSAAIDYLLDGGETTIVNAGSGTGATILEMLAAAERVLGRAIERVEGARRPGDPPSLVANIEKAERLLGWRPERSTVDQILRDALAWHTADGQIA